MPIGRLDRTPAPSPRTITMDDKDLVWVLDVRGEYGRLLGKISIRTRGDLATGRLKPLTSCLLPVDEQPGT